MIAVAALIFLASAALAKADCYTNTTYTEPYTLSDAESADVYLLEAVTVNNQIMLYNVTRYSGSTAPTFFLLYAGNKSQVGNWSYSGDVAQVNILLNASSYYFADGGGTYNRQGLNSGVSYPFSSSDGNLTFTNSYHCDGAWSCIEHPTFYFEIYKITYGFNGSCSSPSPTNNVTLNAPADNASASSNRTYFNYTPTFFQPIASCSLFTNVSGWAAANTSYSIVNGTQNTMAYTFGSDGAYLWNVRCYNSTGSSDAFTSYESNYAFIDTFNSMTGWAAKYNTTAMADWTHVFKEGNQSMNITMTPLGGTRSCVQKNLSSPVNVASFDYIQMENYVSNNTSLTRYELRIGSDISNYREYRNSTVYKGWTDTIWEYNGNYTSFGTPDMSAVDFVQLCLYYPTSGITITSWLADSIWVHDGLTYLSPNWTYVENKPLYGITIPGGSGSFYLTGDSRPGSSNHGRITINLTNNTTPSSFTVNVMAKFVNDNKTNAWLRVMWDFFDGHNYSGVYLSRPYSKAGIEEYLYNNRSNVEWTKAINLSEVYNVTADVVDTNITLYLNGTRIGSYITPNPRRQYDSVVAIETYGGVDTDMGNSSLIQISSFSLSTGGSAYETATNRTLTVNANPAALTAAISYPTDGLSYFQYANFTLNGTVSCTANNCGNVFVYPHYSSSGAGVGTWTDDYVNGTFYGSSMNSSGTLIALPNLTQYRRPADNMRMAKGVGDVWWNYNVGWPDPFRNHDTGVYDVLWDGSYGTYYNTSIIGSTFYSFTDNYSTNMTNGGQKVVIPESWNAGYQSGCYQRRYNASFKEMWCSGDSVPQLSSTDQKFMYYTSSDANSTWTPTSGTPQINTTFPNNCESLIGPTHAGFPHVWTEGNTNFMLYLCVPDSPGQFRWVMMNYTDATNLSTYKGMGIKLTSPSQELIMSGIVRLPYNATTSIYYIFFNEYGGSFQGLGLAYMYNDWVINYNAAQQVVPTGTGWDSAWMGFGKFVLDNNGYPDYNAGDMLNLLYTGESGVENWQAGYMKFNYTNAEYESAVRDIGAGNTWTGIGWTNTSCGTGCDVKVQFCYSSTGSSYTCTANYTSNQTVSLSYRYGKYRVHFAGNITDAPVFSGFSATYSSSSDNNDMVGGHSLVAAPMPYACGYLNQTSPNCSFSFDVNGTVAGSYDLTVIANSTAVTNSSSAKSIAVYPKPSASLTLTNNNSWSGAFGSPSLTTGGGCPAELTCNLYRNGTGVSNPNSDSLGAGAYVYVYNTTGNSNYSATSITQTLTIAKGTPLMNITFNTTNPANPSTAVAATCNYPAEVPATFFFSPGGLVSSPYEFTTGGLGSSYAFVCNTTGSANYSAYSTSANLTVAIIGALSIDGIYDELTGTNLTANITIFNSTFGQVNTNITSYYNNSVRNDLTIAVSSYGYITRYYYVNIPSDGGTHNLTAYLLPSVSGSYITFWGTSGRSPLGESGMIVDVYRFIGSSYKLVSQQVGDSQGKGTLFLDPVAVYKVDARTSDSLMVSNLSAYAPNPTFVLRIDFGGSGSGGGSTSTTTGGGVVIVVNNTTGNVITTAMTDMNWSLTPSSGYWTQNNVSNVTLVNFTVSVTDSSIEWQYLRILMSNRTELYSANSTASSGISQSVNVNYGSLSGTVYAEAMVKRAGFSVLTANNSYIISSMGSTGIGGMLSTAQASSGMDKSQLSFIAMFLSYLVALGIAAYARSGSGIFFLAGLTIAALVGWFDWGFLIGMWMLEVGIIMYKESY